MQKERYEAQEMETVVFDTEDVIRTSQDPQEEQLVS